MLCTKSLLLMNFVPQKESFENIKVNSLFTSQSKVKTVQSLIWSIETRHNNKQITAQEIVVQYALYVSLV